MLGFTRSKDELTTKIHATCDARGNPTSFRVTPGQAHDLEGADALLPEIVADMQAFRADKAYDAPERVLSVLETAGVKAVIPPKAHRIVQREYDAERYHRTGATSDGSHAWARVVGRNDSQLV